MDIFTWSIPFVTEKSYLFPYMVIVTEMLYHIIKHDEGETMSDDEIGEDDIKQFKDMTTPHVADKDKELLKQKSDKPSNLF